LLDDQASIVGRPMKVAGVGGVTAPPTRDLALDEAAERDVHRRSAQAGAEGTPRLVADLDARHPIARGFCPRGCLPFALSTSPTHVYVVDDAPDGATVCCEAERSDASGGKPSARLWCRGVAS